MNLNHIFSFFTDVQLFARFFTFVFETGLPLDLLPLNDVGGIVHPWFYIRIKMLSIFCEM